MFTIEIPMPAAGVASSQPGIAEIVFVCGPSAPFTSNDTNYLMLSPEIPDSFITGMREIMNGEAMNMDDALGSTSGE